MNFWTKALFFTRFYSQSSTIFSLSSGFGKCGVAVIRISGPNTLIAVKQISKFKNSPIARHAYLKSLYHPSTNKLIDKGLVLWFPEPNSFTGEDCCEFQIHGGPAVISAMLDALNQINGLRQANPGEFTKRAFYNGKLDLTVVEGLADLIHAETEAQRKQAILQVNGSLSTLYKNWRQQLLKCIAQIEAYIDFSEDQNIEDNVLDECNERLAEIENELKIHLEDGRKGERLRQGVRTVIIGQPNVGKSSFMNLLCRKNCSIVTNIAGTTRDIIEIPFNISGYPMLIADTAGLRTETDDIIENEGISRAKDYAEMADLLILLIDANDLNKYIDDNNNREVFLPKYLKVLNLDKTLFNEKTFIFIVNKCDLLAPKELIRYQESFSGQDFVFVSCKTENGIVDVIETITKHLKQLCGEPSAMCPTLTQERHRQLLKNCLKYLKMYRENFQQNSIECQDFAIAAQQIRNSVRCIGAITGEVSTEDVLDVIFKEFCIGK